ncbi:MAG TPA: DUF692 domain-containing protein [Actinomycetota bacterium]|nr:DUF692 domain-containing protein [Actinomycetota bacterium]
MTILPLDHGRIRCHLPDRAGIGLKAQHCEEIVASRPAIGFVEVHAENYMMAGGPPLRMLEKIRSSYPLSLHGIGLSIGGDGPLDRAHLMSLKKLLDRFAPAAFSEHLAWSTHNGIFLNNLLPVPYVRRTLARVCDHIDLVQERLGVRMLLENPSSYVVYERSEMTETEFLCEVVKRTGCGLLLDVSNVFVSAVNLAFDPEAYIAGLPAEHIGEIHLAGFSERHDEGGRVLVDAHASPVDQVVWSLYEQVLRRTGPVPTLIEWDHMVPRLPVLLEDAREADRVLAEESIRRSVVRRSA